MLNKIRVFSFKMKFFLPGNLKLTRIIFVFFLTTLYFFSATFYPVLASTYSISPSTYSISSGGDAVFNASGYSSSSATASSSQVALSTASDWVDTNWSYRKAIIITGSTAGVQTNYQVQVSVTYDSDMQADFDDIRFTDSNGTTLVDHWLESKTDSTSAVFWVEVPTIPASPSTTTIYMYYGNGSASSVSDGDSTFIFFDGFDGSDGDQYDSSKWTFTTTAGTCTATKSTTQVYSGSTSMKIACASGSANLNRQFSSNQTNIAIRARMYDNTTDNATNRLLRIASVTGPAEVIEGVAPGTSATYYTSARAGVWDTSSIVRSTGWHLFEYRQTTTTLYLDVDSTQTRSVSSTGVLGSSNNYIGIADWASVTADIWLDNYIVRKYVSSEPSVGAAGTETGPYASSGTWTSASLDLADVSSWASLSDTATLNGGTITYETQTSSDNSTWSDWEAVTGSEPWAIASPAGRYLKIRATLNAASNQVATPALTGITVAYTSTGDNVFNASGYSSSSTTASSSQVALSTANWSYRKAIIITGSTAGVQTNYQVQVSVTYDSDMQADFDDIRFTDSDGTTLVDHWLESKTDSASAVFWVEVPTIPASPSTTTIYMYYGNGSASSVSDGDSTFLFFDDDFITDVVYEEAFTSLDSDVWRMIDPEGDGTFSISEGIAEIHAGTNDGNSCNHILGFPSGKTSRGDLTIEYRAKTNNYNVASGNDPKWGFKETRNDQYVVFAGKTDDRTHLYALTGGDFSASSAYTQLSVDYSEYHVYRIELTDSDAKFYIDDALVATHTTYLPNTSGDYNIRPYAAVGGGNTGGFEHIAYIDYVNLNMEQSLDMDKWGFGGTFLDRTLGAIDGDMHIAIPDQVGSYGGIILSTKQSFTPGFALKVKSNIILNKNVQYHLSDIKGHISSDGIRTQDYGAGGTYNHQKAVGGVWTTVDTSSITTGSHEIEYIIDASGNAKYLVDDAEEASTTGINTGVPYYFVPYTQYASGASEQKIDQVYARKYASSEPSVGAAGAETSPLYASSGTWTSASLDLTSISSGASLSDAVTLNGGTISYETQSSNDNSTWSDWEAGTGAGPYTIQSPSGRYLKIRATLTSSGGQTATPILTGLVVTYTQNQNPDVPFSLGPSALVDGSWGADNTPTLTFTISDPDASEQVKFQIQIDDSSDFSSVLVDYTSVLQSEGSASFTVGQAAGSGSYTTGSEGQTLSDASYYWRVKAIDDDSGESSYSTANSGAIALKIDAASPSTPGTPSTTTPTTDTTPAWTWTASTDSGSGLAATPYTLQWSADSNFASGISSSTSSTNSFTHTTPLVDGTWYFRVKAADAVDNESSYSSNGSVLVDSTVPSAVSSLTSSSHIVSTWSSDNTIDVSWTVATDTGGSGIAGYSYLFDTTSDTTPSASLDGTGTSTTSSIQPDGSSIYFHVRAVDNMSNWGSAVHLGPFYIDTTAPSIPGTPSTTTPTNDSTPTWSFTASTDGGSGLHATTPYSVQWCTDSGFTGCEANTATSTTNSYTHSVVLVDGTWYFRVKAADAVDNESSYSSNGSVLVDTAGGGAIPTAWFNPPQPPTGGFKVLINNGEEDVNSQKVELALTGGPNTERMAISNFPDFQNSSQEPYAASKKWDLCKWRTSCLSGEYTVYAKFYTSWGASSEIVSDSIFFREKPIVEMTIVELQERINELLARVAQLKIQLQEFLKQENILEIPPGFTFVKPFHYGQTGNEIKYLQEFLKNQGQGIYPEALVTGYFGPLTKEAIKKFQLKYGLIPSGKDIAAGYLGPKTRAKINEVLGR